MSAVVPTPSKPRAFAKAAAAAEAAITSMICACVAGSPPFCIERHNSRKFPKDQRFPTHCQWARDPIVQHARAQEKRAPGERLVKTPWSRLCANCYAGRRLSRLAPVGVVASGALKTEVVSRTAAAKTQ
jgi:hypothetical protein